MRRRQHRRDCGDLARRRFSGRRIAPQLPQCWFRPPLGFGRWHWLLRATGLFFLITLVGCREQDTTTAATADPAASPPSQALVPGQGQVPGERQALQVTAIGDPADTAKPLFESLVARYRNAVAYSDRGSVQLTYRQNGTPQIDTAPLSVQYVAPDRLQLRAYTLQMLCDGGQLSAQVTDPLSSDLDNQRLQQPLPAGRLTLDAKIGRAHV